MILDSTYKKEWLLEQSRELQKGDSKLLEKAVMALTLLEQLSLKKIDFVFKGGTSLILVLKEPRRFSIDIDIIISKKPGNIISIFNEIVNDSPFTKWLSDNERKKNIQLPMEHYKFYYNSVVDSYFGEEPILLDILFDTHYFEVLNNTSVKHKWIKTSAPVTTVKVPSLECILGDKLTAFAPNTTGILYKKNKPIEIIKQLYDIGYLFNVVKNFTIVSKTFESIAKSEIFYRGLKIKSEDVLRDILDTSIILSERNIANKHFQHLQTGVSNIYNFIFIEKFRIESAIICSSKAAYLSQLIKKGETRILAQFLGPEEIRDLTIESKKFYTFNRFKKIIPEAFFYWYHTINLLTNEK